MFIIWRGFGWVVPIIVIAIFLSTATAVDALFHQGYNASNAWPKILGALLASTCIGALGYFLNHKKRVTLIVEETGQRQKSPSHALFFIPIEYWSVIVLALSIWLGISSSQDFEEDIAYLNSPVINDLYTMNFKRAFGVKSEHEYGVVKVVAVDTLSVELLLSKSVYKSIRGPSSDVRKNKTNGTEYFSRVTKSIPFKELAALREIQTISSVYRK
jgi:stalled ribosome alternative rescue factor ArfA